LSVILVGTAFKVRLTEIYTRETMKSKHFVVSSIAALMIAPLGMLVADSPAAAIPTGCRKIKQIYSINGLVRVTCTGGSGYYRAVAWCSVTPKSTSGTYVYGPWRYPGQDYFSEAACGSLYYRAGGYDF
jgi:hypothetical protein